jgi:sec-independent protein translocase protein TatA
MGLFGLGAPEIAVILAVAAFVLGPEKLASMAKDAGKGLGEMKDVPAGFNEGFQEASSSEETKGIARSLGATTAAFKDTAADMAGEYKEVATEFTAGVKEGAQGASRELVSGLEVTNNLVSDVREGVQTIKTNVNGPAEPKEAEVVQDVPADAPNRTGSA